MNTVPSCSMSILTPVSSIILLICLPLGPITSRILSGLIVIVIIFGAYADNSVRGSAITDNIWFRMCTRPTFACCNASSKISRDRPSILMSICNAVTPCAVPATLKSISPK